MFYDRRSIKYNLHTLDNIRCRVYMSDTNKYILWQNNICQRHVKIGIFHNKCSKFLSIFEILSLQKCLNAKYLRLILLILSVKAWKYLFFLTFLIILFRLHEYLLKFQTTLNTVNFKLY